MRNIPIQECGEPLVNFLEGCPRLRLDRPRFNYRRETLMRRGLVERLCRAAERLPEGYSFAVVEGWRPPFIQQRMYRSVEAQVRGWFPHLEGEELRRKVEQFSAPMDDHAPPPHTTGGAVDLFLSGPDGNPLNLHAPYDYFDPEGFAFDAPDLTSEARDLRRLMRQVLASQDVTNYPSEYWHYSYGDQGWAYRGNHHHALYAATEPPNWHPDPADVSEEPLEMLRD